MNDNLKQRINGVLSRIAEKNPEKFKSILSATNGNFSENFQEVIENFIKSNFNNTESIKLLKDFGYIVRNDETRKMIEKKIKEDYFL